jgi:hypothetical protein
MASSSDHQEQISSYIQLLASMVGELSFVPHDFSALVLPLQAHLNLLKILHTTNLHLENPALSVLDDTRRACTQVRKDVRQFFESSSVDLSSFKSQGKNITQLGKYIETRTAVLYVAALHAAQYGQRTNNQDSTKHTAGFRDSLSSREMAEPNMMNCYKISEGYSTENFIRLRNI